MWRHIVAAACVVIWVALLMVYRAVYVEPREWGAICASDAAKLACSPRAALLWLQNFQLWGAGALLLGVWAVWGAPLWVRVAAVGIGAAAVINYNATWGMLGLALGAWAWTCGRD